jgi:hypothetical protein
LRDPRGDTLRAMTQGRQAADVVSAVRGITLMPQAVAEDEAFWDQVTPILHDMLTRPMTEVISQEAA